MHQRGERRVHGGQQDRGEAGLYARKDRDARSDVYSLGLTLYEMLAFRPAFVRLRSPLFLAGQWLEPWFAR